MITFGLTGGIACGKSTVTKTFRRLDIPMVDADQVARDVVIPGSKGLSLVVDAFGSEYLNEDGTLNRTKLGALVFSNVQALSKINKLMSPLIQDESDRQVQKAHQDGHQLVGYDAALICEQGNASRYRPLIVVVCSQQIQLERLMKRNSLTHDEAMSRINAQMSVEDKKKMADFVIDSSGTVEESIASTENIIKTLRSML